MIVHRAVANILLLEECLESQQVFAVYFGDIQTVARLLKQFQAAVVRHKGAVRFVGFDFVEVDCNLRRETFLAPFGINNVDALGYRVQLVLPSLGFSLRFRQRSCRQPYPLLGTPLVANIEWGGFGSRRNCATLSGCECERVADILFTVFAGLLLAVINANFEGHALASRNRES